MLKYIMILKFLQIFKYQHPWKINLLTICSRSKASIYDIHLNYMKYITIIIGLVLLIAVYSSVTFSDKFAVLGHGYSQEKITDIRHTVFSGVRTSTHNH